MRAEKEKIKRGRKSLVDPRLRDWSKVNNAIYKANDHKAKLIILCACNHDGKKMKHHPDYDKPLEVELLCYKCHFRKHAQLNKAGIRLY